jgi:23S rRNA pseudouridine2605 synthase
MSTLRLQVILARAGIASRRAAEALVREGSVTVNGAVVRELGTKADPQKDEIAVRGQPLGAPPDKVYVLLYKPSGTLTTLSDPRGRKTVIELLPPFARDARLFPVGRLDWDTEGALLMTNDGPLANALTHPRYGAARTYHVKLKGRIGEEAALVWLQGANLADGPARADAVEILRRTRDAGHTWIEVTLHEGRNREVKRLAAALGQTVLKLRRPIFAGLNVEGMRPGEWRLLEDHEVEMLRELGRSSGATLDERRTTLPAPRGALPREALPVAEPGGRGRRFGHSSRGDRGGRPERGPRGGREERPPARPERAARPERPPSRPPKRTFTVEDDASGAPSAPARARTRAPRPIPRRGAGRRR